MKKILIFSLAYYPSHVSGAEAAIYEITNRIDDIEFHLITLRFNHRAPKQDRIGNVLVHRIGFGGYYIEKIFFIPMAALKARMLHRVYHFDAVWSVMTYMLFPVVLAKFLGVRAPHILTLQDGDPYDKVFNRWFIKPVAPLLDYGFHAAGAIQAISSYLAEWPQKRGSHIPVEIIHNGANPRDIAAEFDQRDIDELKAELGKKPDDVFLVNTARLVHQKGNDDTIRALQYLPARIKLVLVGGGSDEGMLKDLANELGLTERVIFVGSVDRSVVSNYRQVADIFVGPSRSEGLGNAFLSAMASRIPVVTTQEGGLAEFVFDEKRNSGRPATAWVVDTNSPEQIADAIKDILEHPEKVKKITKTAREIVVENYNWDRIAHKMQTRIFNRVLFKKDT